MNRGTIRNLGRHLIRKIVTAKTTRRSRLSREGVGKGSPDLRGFGAAKVGRSLALLTIKPETFYFGQNIYKIRLHKKSLQ